VTRLADHGWRASEVKGVRTLPRATWTESKTGKCLTTALRQLPDQQREIAVMRFILDLSVTETASLLRIPEGTVKSATHRALRALRGHLDGVHSPLPMEVGHAD